MGVRVGGCWEVPLVFDNQVPLLKVGDEELWVRTDVYLRTCVRRSVNATGVRETAATGVREAAATGVHRGASPGVARQ